MSQSYTLYGAEISYYSGKVRAYLRYKGIPFEEQPADRAAYRDVILPRVGWPVIPVVVTPEDTTLQDSTDIIDALEADFPNPSVYPSGPVQKLVALMLEVYADEWLMLPAMHYRWNHNTEWIIREFGRLSVPNGTQAEQVAAGEKTCGPFRGSLPMLGVIEATIPAIEASYEGLLRELNDHFANHSYLLGQSPCIGDFGLIGPLYAHQYRDPASGQLMERSAPNLVSWVQNMMAPGGLIERRRVQRRGDDDRREDQRRQETRGDDRRNDDRREDDRRSLDPLDWMAPADFMADDAIPETLIPILQRMVREQFPALAATRASFEAWNADHPDEEIPRATGTHEFTLEAGRANEVTASCAARTFPLWMFQRVQDHYASLDGADREAADGLLDRIGGKDLLTAPQGTRLARRDFKLVRA